MSRGGRLALAALLAALAIPALALPAWAQSGAPTRGIQTGMKSPGRASSPLDPMPTKLEQIDSPSMHFSIARAGKRNTIFAWGHIADGDADKLEAAIQAATPVEEMWIFSGGGNLEEGLEMGRVIRRHHLSMRVPNNMRCISACNFVFLGGTVRTIDSGGTFEVHMFAAPGLANQLIRQLLSVHWTFDDFNARFRNHPLGPDDLKEWNQAHDDSQLDEPHFVAQSILGLQILGIQQDSAQTAAEIARFLSEMSISLKFLTQFANIPNETPRPLTRDELRDFNITNAD